MLNAFQTFENDCLAMAPEFMLPVGIGLVGIGLCLWLGGLNWPRIAGGLLGALIAGICTLFLPMLKLNIILGIIGISAVVGAILDKPAIIFSGGIATAVISLIAFAPAIEFDSNTPSPVMENSQTQTTLSASQSAVFGFEWIEYFATNIGASINQNEPLKKAISTGAALAVIFVGIALRRLVSAIACSAIGTIVVFSGMIILLLHKGSQPLTNIYQKPEFYATAAVCMVIFGTLSELLLCPVQKNKNKQINKNGEQK
jgi:uncharacterized membrane protein YwzB